jgi:hypothetical protein
MEAKDAAGGEAPERTNTAMRRKRKKIAILLSRTCPLREVIEYGRR